MEMKVFRYSRFGYVALFFYTLLFTIMLGTVLFISLRDGSIYIAMVSGGLWLGYLLLLLMAWRVQETVITVTDSSLIFQMPFKRHQISWSDIEEVGAYRMSGVGLGYPMIYIKSCQLCQQKLKVNLRFIESRELVSILFEKSNHAKFVKLENQSWLPFIRRMKRLEWKKEDGLPYLFWRL